MSGAVHTGLQAFGHEFAKHFTPAGTRLGVAVLNGVPPAIAEAIDAAVVDSGLTPARRVARLRPRFHEDHIRPADVVDFIVRYGHEYVAVVLPTSISAPDDSLRIQSACDDSGCALWWYSEAP